MPTAGEPHILKGIGHAPRRVLRLVVAGVVSSGGAQNLGCEESIVESKTGMIALTNQADGKALAVVTLHDLLRAQLAAGEREQQ